jgi:hypothetical protein
MNRRTHRGAATCPALTPSQGCLAVVAEARRGGTARLSAVPGPRYRRRRSEHGIYPVYPVSYGATKRDGDALRVVAVFCYPELPMICVGPAPPITRMHCRYGRSAGKAYSPRPRDWLLTGQTQEVCRQKEGSL